MGIAGWSVPPQYRGWFPQEGSHLARYAQRYNAVEINSSFYRPHRPATYAKWAASVPAAFKFAAKIPKEITHTRKLIDCVDVLDRFLGEASHLAEKQGPLLLQLPPKLAYDPVSSPAFFDLLRARYQGDLVFEPRHVTWFEPELDALLLKYRVARVAADPAPVPAAAEPAGQPDLVYFRLHGSPDMYYSAYEESYLQVLARRMTQLVRAGAEVWCIFDNTARQHATLNGLRLIELLTADPRGLP